ncbi:hypothetical protein ACIQNG_01930 [Streptomyces sp. NPDC091377]|uniref:hypothetical protein n=1 Tax=unclassified Streptomyces TaxID=2593676 RepID=UPI0038222BEF
MTPHHDVDTCVENLRAALKAHDITLPSLGVDLPTFENDLIARPLVALGNCNIKTALALTDVLLKAAEE